MVLRCFSPREIKVSPQFDKRGINIIVYVEKISLDLMESAGNGSRLTIMLKSILGFDRF